MVVKLCRAFRRRCLVDRLAVRPGSSANRNRLRRHASLRFGGSSEAGGKATSAEPGGKHSGVSPDIVDRAVNRPSAIVNRPNAIGGARFSIGENCQPGEIRQQLQRWLRNKLQIRECSLGWMQRVGRLFFDLLGDVHRHTHLQILCGVQRDQGVPGLGQQ
jgi:Zn ribbon nucleic-acid-binding protein